TVSGGLNSATSTASAATRVKAARWCRKAIAADAYISSWRGGVGSGGGVFACRGVGAQGGDITEQRPPAASSEPSLVFFRSLYRAASRAASCRPPAADRARSIPSYLRG